MLFLYQVYGSGEHKTKSAFAVYKDVPRSAKVFPITADMAGSWSPFFAGDRADGRVTQQGMGDLRSPRVSGVLTDTAQPACSIRFAKTRAEQR